MHYCKRQSKRTQKVAVHSPAVLSMSSHQHGGAGKNLLSEKEMARRRKERDKRMAKEKKERDRKKREAVKDIYAAPIELDQYEYIDKKCSEMQIEKGRRGRGYRGGGVCVPQLRRLSRLGDSEFTT